MFTKKILFLLNNLLAGFNRDRGNFRDNDRSRFDSNRDDRRGFGSRRFENDRDGLTRDRDDRDPERVSCKLLEF